MKITVLYGGQSAEREISLKSGAGVAKALESRGHQVTLLDTADPAHAIKSGSEMDAIPATLSSAGSSLQPARILSTPAIRDTEVVFIALHGGEGENGTLQALLDLAGVAYTGSGVLSSALAMDKRMSKIVFAHSGIPTPPWAWIKPGADPGLSAAEVSSVGGYPLVVKPNDQGSTIGLSIIQEAVEFRTAVDLARRYSPGVLIERFIPGRELSVPVVSGKALPVIEIQPTHGIYDYECKYTRGLSSYLCPAPLDTAATAYVQDLAERAYESLGCEGAARVDFRLDPQDIAWCLEVNTIPGMTETSLVPMAAQAQGIHFAEFVERLCAQALEARRRKQDLTLQGNLPCP